MNIVGILASVLNALLLVFVLFLLIRLILDWMPMLNREWRPKGFGLVAAEIVYTITDPPIKLFRRFIPPLRVGAIAIDFAYTATMLLCFVLLGITGSLAA
ncbi:YggT family protein [Microbacterium sp. P01]|uniref:YggT family protein n=1 Tax=unclassified Microbacterium TaxID=2609290 RepID=UPI00366CF2E7